MLADHEHTLSHAQSTAREEAVDVSLGRSLAKNVSRTLACMLLHVQCARLRLHAGSWGPYPPTANGRSVPRYHGHPVPRRSPRPGRPFSLVLHTI